MFEVFIGLTDGKNLKKKYSKEDCISLLNISSKDITEIYGVFEGDIEQSIIYKTSSLTKAVKVAKDAIKYLNQRVVYINTDKYNNDKRFSQIDGVRFDTSLEYTRGQIYFVGDYFKKNNCDCSLIPFKLPRKKKDTIRVECFIFDNLDNIKKTIQNIAPFVQRNYFFTLYSMEVK